MPKANWTKALTDYASDEKQSYETIAKKYGVSKRSVVKRAVKDDWQLVRRDTALKVHQELPNIVSQSVVEIQARHIYFARMLQAKALEAIIKDKLKPKNIREAVLCLKTGIEIERKALGLDNPKQNNDVYVPGTRMYLISSKDIDKFSKMNGQ